MISDLEDEPHLGAPIGRGCYKVRMAIRSKGKGKSGGARVITYVVAVRETVSYFPSTTSPSRKA